MENHGLRYLSISTADAVVVVPPDVYIGGAFGLAGGHSSNYIAKWTDPVLVSNEFENRNFPQSEPSIYPNPARHSINIIHEKKPVGPTNYLLYNLLGQLVYSKERSEQNEKTELDVSDLAPGVYFLIIHNDNNTQTTPIVIR